MKINFLVAFLVLASLAAAAAAQSVVITKKEVTYTRRKPVDEYKKTFTVNYPKVRAATPALSKKIEASLSYEVLFPYYKLKEELSESQWLAEANYEVGYNQNGVLSVILTIDGSGAYPDGSSRHVVVDLRNGMRVKPADTFTNLTGLLAQVRKAKDKEVAQAKRELKKDPDASGVDETFAESAKYHPVTLSEFTVSGKGVTFYHDYDFAHVIQAMEPDGEYFFSWAQLRPYIKRGGLLSRLSR